MNLADNNSFTVKTAVIIWPGMIPHDQIQPDEYLNQIANFYRSSRCSNDLPSGYDSQKKRTGK